jgi:hypothetical protein
MELFVGATITASLLAFGLSLGRFMAKGQWHKRKKHSCGTHMRGEYKAFFDKGRPCPGCGVEDGNWTTHTMRATWPLGWRYMQ